MSKTEQLEKLFQEANTQIKSAEIYLKDKDGALLLRGSQLMNGIAKQIFELQNAIKDKEQ
jgi:hypothetical protein